MCWPNGHPLYDRITTRMSESSSTIRSLVGSIVGGGSLLLALLGAVLFVIPEPITSVLGAVLILIGVGGWLVGRVAG